MQASETAAKGPTLSFTMCGNNGKDDPKYSPTDNLSAKNQTCSIGAPILNTMNDALKILVEKSTD